MTHATSLKSTIVRSMSMTLFGSLLGCAAALPPPAAGASCALGEQLVCETFASARSCRCAGDADVERALASFGSPAWPGALR